MWLVTFITISSLITVSIASNFYVNTVGGCDSLFHLQHGNALLNHVIKTLPLFIADCMTACQKTLSCFSINYYENKNKGFMCDLNRSTKKQDPGSYVRMPGYAYGEAEAENKMYCERDVCHQKEALHHSWYQLASSKFKFISQRKSWPDAKQHCEILGANLASFDSKLANRFVLETINMTSTENATSPSGGSGSSGSAILVNLKMDGTDPSGALSLSNGAAVVVINDKKVILFDGQDDYATIPRFDIQADVTIALWMKLASLSNYFLISDYDSIQKQYMFRLYISVRKLKFSLYNTDGVWIINFGSTSEVPTSVWMHVAATWNHITKEAKLFLDGKSEGSITSTLPNTNVHKTPHNTFAIGADKSGSGNKFQLSGYMRELSIVAKALNQNDISILKDNPLSGQGPESAAGSEGTWIGLNDISSEGTFQWSDKSPLHYDQLQVSENTEDKDCALLPKTGNSSSKWMIAACAQEKYFLCKKK